jgi:hypothetical protein
MHNNIIKELNIMAVSKKVISDMVYKLSDRDFSLVAELITRLTDSSSDLNAQLPCDDEPLTEEDIQAIQQGEKELKADLTIRFEDIKHELLQD